MEQAFRIKTAGLDEEAIQHRVPFSETSSWLYSAANRGRQLMLVKEYHSRLLPVLKTPEIESVASVGVNLIGDFLDRNGFPFSRKVKGKKLVVAGDMQAEYRWLAKGERTYITYHGQNYLAFQLSRCLKNFEPILETYDVAGYRYPLISLATESPDRTVWLMRYDGKICSEEQLECVYALKREKKYRLSRSFDQIVVPMVDFNSLSQAQFLRGMKVCGQEISQVFGRFSFRMSERGTGESLGHRGLSNEKFVFDGPFIACVEDIYCGPIAVGYFCPEDSWRQPFHKL